MRRQSKQYHFQNINDKIAFSSYNKKAIDFLFMSFLECGMVLDHAFTLRKYFLFGKKEYFVVMKPKPEDEETYQAKLKKLVDAEEYEKAHELQKKHLQSKTTINV